MKDQLSQREFQELVFLTGSKKAFARFLGIETKEAIVLWRKHQLKLPLEWLRDAKRQDVLEMLAQVGSTKALAKQMGCSDSSIRKMLGSQTIQTSWSEEEIIQGIERYKTVEFAARMMRTTPTQIRKRAEELDLDLADMIDYSFGLNQNAKGRRAELKFKEIRGSLILKDLNKEEGSQATADFLDERLGRVNVKSSRMYSYKASTRKDNPQFWKMSTSGGNASDNFVFMAYCGKMQELVGILVLPTKLITAKTTITLLKKDLVSPDVLLSL